MVELNLYLGKYDLPIREIKFQNLTIISGRSGAGKTYLVSGLMKKIEGSKLLLTSKGGCEFEYLSNKIDKRIPYFDWWESYDRNADKILNSLFQSLSKEYRTIIIDDIPLFFQKERKKIIKECLRLKDTEFFLISIEPITGN